ncbi:hypothetical protein JY97_00565 [Alkalispirochaeta odontotermitis]|nr:hypothetical protein JY97_00565 [Alkalispirochaeta odontotermitis]
MGYIKEDIFTESKGFMTYIPTVGKLDDALESLILQYKCKGDKSALIKLGKGQSRQAHDCAAHELAMREFGEGGSDLDQSIAVEQLKTNFDIGSELCESPIERTILPALLIAEWVGCEHFPAKVASAELGEVPNLIEPSRALIVPQLRVAGRRLDFALFLPIELAVNGFAIECDGRDYHNAIDDVDRDIEMAKAGFATLRFTGSQIHNNPFECALIAAHQVSRFEGRSPQ